MWILVFQRLLIDFFIDIFYFPVWWYSAGAKRALIGCWHLIREANISMAPGLWLKNIFVPMFGQRDWQGRIMSFFMRLVNVIGRGIALFIWSASVFALFFIWLGFPIFLSMKLLQSLGL